MLGVTQRPSSEHRYGRQRGLRYVAASIEARAAGRRRNRDPQLSPIALGRVAQLLEGRCEDVVSDADFSFGEHDTLWRDRAVREIAALTMKLGETVEHFLEHEDRRTGRNGLAARGRAREQVGKACAAGEIVDKTDVRQATRLANHVANRKERRVIEFFDKPKALVEGELEGGHRGEFGPNQEALLGRTAVDVAHQ